jgi:hypothetical protein
MTVVLEEKEAKEHCIKMSGHAEKRTTRTTCVPNGIDRSYDMKYTLIVINYAEKTNNCNATRTFCVEEANVQRWKEPKQKLIDLNTTQKSVPRCGHFQELEKETVEFVCFKTKTEVLITCKTIKY